MRNGHGTSEASILKESSSWHGERGPHDRRVEHPRAPSGHVVELWTVVAIVLLVGGVVGSVVPAIPSGISAIVGVWSYYLFVPGDPAFGLGALAGFTLLGVLAAVAEFFAGILASKAGGANTRTALLAGAVGFALLFVVGPVGVLLGVGGTVLAIELYDGKPPAEAVRAAGWTLAGMLGSSLGQLLFTLPILVGFLLLVGL